MTKRNGDYLTDHHIVPVSRSSNGKIPKTKNVLRVNSKAHEAWHLLFGTATPEEAIKIIAKYWSSPEPSPAVIIPRECNGYYKPPE